MTRKGKTSNIADLAKAARKQSRDAEIARGWAPRAQTFADRKKVASRRACRGYKHAG